MSKPTDAYVLFAGVYPNKELATEDLRAIRKLQSAGELTNVSAAVITKDEKGKLHLHESTSEGKDAAAAGLLVGAVPGIILAAVFPPAGLAFLGWAVIQGVSFSAILGAAGHFHAGLSRKAVREIASTLDEGQSAIVAVAVDAEQVKLESVLAKADKKITRALDKGDIEKAADELSHSMDKVDALV